MSFAEPTLKPWTTEERENFFAAIERNRREAAYIATVGWCCSAIIAVVVAILMAPLVCGVVILLSDLVNLIHPLPDPVKIVAAHFQPIAHGKGVVPWSSWIALGALLAAPGLALMLLAIAALHRSLHKSPALAGHSPPGTAPDPRELAEQRLANVVSELCVAATLPTPQIRIVDGPQANAFVMGASTQAYTVVVTRPLLQALNRAQLQGAVAHLIGSVADGDLMIGMRSTIHAALLAMVGNFKGGRSTVREFRHLLLCAIRPGRIDATQFLAELEERREEVSASNAQSKGTSILYLVVAGPVLVQFFAGMTAEFLLKPLLALAWRRRKYMADATAVRLTRDPDALAGALEQVGEAHGGGTIISPDLTVVPAYAAHLALLTSKDPKPLMDSLVSPVPSIDRRLRALAKMGAHLRHAPRQMSLAARLIIGGLFAAVGALMLTAVVLMVYVSAALSGMFTIIPIMILHSILRWLGVEIHP